MTYMNKNTGAPTRDEPLISPEKVSPGTVSSGKKPSLIIIGGGISGLSAGCYAAMNGFSVTVLEMHDKPGGCCTSWDRRGYTFDPCISWLNGSGNDNNDELSEVWRELNTFDGKTINQVEIFNTVSFDDGTNIQFYCDPDKLESHLLNISPKDASHIKKYCRYVRDFRKCSRHFPFLKAQGLRNFWDKTRMMYHLLPYMRTFTKTMSTTVEEFAAEFKHPKLREAFRYILLDAVKGLPLLPSCINVANAADKNAGVPAGGSLSISRALEKRLLELGGSIRYKTYVEKINIKNDITQGVTLRSGEVMISDFIIGASDGYNQIYNMTGGKYRTDTIDEAFSSFENSPGDIFPGTVCMFLGVDDDYTHLPSFSTFILTDEERKSLPGLHESGINVQIRSKLFPDSAPNGKSVIYISFLSDYGYWDSLNKDKKTIKTSPEEKSKEEKTNRHTRRKRSVEYRKTKKILADKIIQVLEKRQPGLKEKIEYVDLATPLTCQRYTGNRNGSIFGWTPLTTINDKIEDEFCRLKGKLPGLQGFYMAGHWLGNGGVTRAAHSGRHAIQYICHDNNWPFVVTSKQNNTPAIIQSLT